MSIMSIDQVEFGVELDAFEPDTSLATVRGFARAVGWGGSRFDDHEAARREGLPGALVPGIMGMGFLTTMIHRWAPGAKVEYIDTVFRAPLIADEPCHPAAVVTDIDPDTGTVELDLTIRNAAGETRLFGTATVRFPG